MPIKAENATVRPFQVRLGIGACQFHLGNFARARQAFRRVLQLSPGNTAALVGLAVLAMNEPTLTPAHITEALQLLCQVNCWRSLRSLSLP
jgi:Flp pilus assembly protein TadD